MMKKMFLVLAIIVATGFVLSGITGCDLFTGPPGADGTNGVDGADGADGTNGVDGESPFDVPPHFTNTAALNIVQWGPNLLSLDSGRAITGLFTVKTDGGAFVSGLDEVNFYEAVGEAPNGGAEEGVGPIHISEFGGYEKPIYVIFNLDNTGSMGGIISAIVDDIDAFVTNLLARGIFVKIGITTFGDNYGDTNTPLPGSYVYPTTQDRPYIAPTSTLADLETFLGTVAVIGGDDWYENSYDSISWILGGPNPEGSYQTQAAFGFGGNGVVIINITDAPSHDTADVGNVADWYTAGMTNDLADVIALALSTDTIVHVVGPDIPEYKALAADTGGTWYNISSDFSAILETLSSEVIEPMYRVRYQTPEGRVSGDSVVARMAVRFRISGTDYFADDTWTYSLPAVMPYMSMRGALAPVPVASNY